MIQFIIGAAAGAAAVYWKDDLKKLLRGGLPGMRTKAADQLESIEKNVDTALDGVRSRIRTVLRAGQEELRKPKGEGVNRRRAAGSSAT